LPDVQLVDTPNLNQPAARGFQQLLDGFQRFSINANLAARPVLRFG
jgi:hypothetical protein